MSQKESFDGAVKDNYFDGLVRFDRRDDLIELRNGVRTENIERRMVNGYSPIVGRAPRKMYLLRHLSFGLHILSPMKVQPFVQNHSLPLARRAGIRRDIQLTSSSHGP